MTKLIARSDFHHIIDHPGSGTVLGIKEDKVLLVYLERPGFPFKTYEVPGGVCDLGETHEQAARREFWEETGYELGYTFHFQSIKPSVGYSNEMISVFYAEVLEQTSVPEHEIEWLSKPQVKEFIKEGKIIDSQSLAVLSHWLLSDLNFQLPSVMFVCTGNYYRSRFCEIYFNLLTEGKLPRADSKGLLAYMKSNEGMISPHTLHYLESEGLPLGKMKFPEQIEQRHLETGVRVIAMDEEEHRPMMEKDYPEFANSIEYWQVHDIDFTEPVDALPALKNQVELLVKELLGSKN